MSWYLSLMLLQKPCGFANPNQQLSGAANSRSPQIWAKPGGSFFSSQSIPSTDTQTDRHMLPGQSSHKLQNATEVSVPANVHIRRWHELHWKLEGTRFTTWSPSSLTIINKFEVMSHSIWRDKKKVRKDAAPLFLIYPTDSLPWRFFIQQSEAVPWKIDIPSKEEVHRKETNMLLALESPPSSFKTENPTYVESRPKAPDSAMARICSPGESDGAILWTPINKLHSFLHNSLSTPNCHPRSFICKNSPNSWSRPDHEV